MKKLLALVLALVMTLGLATISANAALSDFSDADAINNEEAMAVMNAVGVFVGSDGKINPQGNLTRAEAAKLIAYLSLGSKAAEAQPAVQVFPDVPATHWAAKYVAYCKDAGIIQGRDGKYLPDEPLTGYAFGAYLLAVLGYDRNIEGMTGATWQIQTAKLMTSNNITKGTDTLGSETLTREEAAQYCLNALKAGMVEYKTKGTSIEINGATIATGASAATKVVPAVTGTTDDVQYDNANDHVQQLAEKLYEGKLVLATSTVDALGRPAHKWTYKGESIDTYADAPVLTFTEAVSNDDMYKALKAYDIKDEVKFSIAAATYTAPAQLYAAQTKADVTLAQAKTLADKTGNGKTVEVYADSNNMITAVVTINPVYAKISNVTNTSANTKHGAYATYTFDSKTGKVYSSVVDEDIDVDTLTLNGTFAKNDYVTYYAVSGGKYVLDPVTSVSGVLTSITSKGVLTIDGASYKRSTVGNAVAPTIAKTSQDFHADKFGYIIAAYSTTPTKYAYVVNGNLTRYVTNSDGSLESKPYATLVFTDGTVETVQTSAAWSTTHDKKVITYTVNNKDAYVYGADAGATIAVNFKGLADDTKNVSDSSNALNLNAKTVYYVLNWAKDDDGTWEFQKTVTAYTGYTNVPAYATEANDIGVALDSDSTADGIANYVFINTTASAVDTGKYVYVKGTYTDIGSGYVYDTIVAGEDDTTTRSKTDLTADTLYKSLGATPVAAETKNKKIQNKGNLLYLDGSYASKTIADDVAVYTINLADDSVSVGTAADLDTEFNADPNSQNGTRGVYVEYDSGNTKATTVYILYNSED